METARFYKKFFRAFATDVETARLSRPRCTRRDSGNGSTQKATARPAWPARPQSAISSFLRPRWTRRDFPDRGGDGATKKQFFGTVGSGSGATFAFGVETARLSRARRRRRDFSDQCRECAIFQTIAETARPRINLRSEEGVRFTVLYFFSLPSPDGHFIRCLSANNLLKSHRFLIMVELNI